MDLLYNSACGLALTTFNTTCSAVAHTVADTDIGCALITTVNGVDDVVCIPHLSFKDRVTTAVARHTDLLRCYLSSAL